MLAGVELVSAYIGLLKSRPFHDCNTTFSQAMPKGIITNDAVKAFADSRLLSYSVQAGSIPVYEYGGRVAQYVQGSRTITARMMIEFPNNDEFDTFMSYMYQQLVHIDSHELEGYGTITGITTIDYIPFPYGKNLPLEIEIEFQEIQRK